MNKVTINGKTYLIPEVNFDAVCELEENGVDLLAMDSRHPKLATTLRGLCAWIMKVEPRVASREIEAHIKAGGNIIEVLEAVTDAMKDSGFFGQSGTERVTPIPRDHQRKKNRNRPDHEKTTDASQTS